MAEKSLVEIKKYPNRRYYDATNSRHITLQEVHDLVVAGHDVRVTDSRNNEDITNLVLMQILLEKDEPKLDVFPSSILHVMIRTNRQALRAMFDRLFGPFLGLMAQSQRQFDAYLRQTMQGHPLASFDWSKALFEPFARGGDGATNGSPAPGPTVQTPGEQITDPVADLKAQLSELQERVEALSISAQSRKAPAKP